jgi:hypothetical protein
MTYGRRRPVGARTCSAIATRSSMTASPIPSSSNGRSNARLVSTADVDETVCRFGRSARKSDASSATRSASVRNSFGESCNDGIGRVSLKTDCRGVSRPCAFARRGAPPTLAAGRRIDWTSASPRLRKSGGGLAPPTSRKRAVPPKERPNEEPEAEGCREQPQNVGRGEVCRRRRVCPIREEQGEQVHSL